MKNQPSPAAKLPGRAVLVREIVLSAICLKNIMAYSEYSEGSSEASERKRF